MAKKFKKLETAQKERLYEALNGATPGTKEYRELQAQLGAFEIMDEKRKSGSVKASDVLKFTGILISTGALIAADAVVPNVAQKLRLGDFVSKLFR